MNFDLGFKALAYPAANLSPEDSVSPCLCSFVFRCDTAKRATLLLVATISTAHDAETQFVLQYDADMLDSSRVELISGRESVTQAQLNEILHITDKSDKKKRFDVKTLHLTITDAPPLWCAAATTSFSPRPGNELAFQQFADLAKARSINIVFDLPGKRRLHREMFKAFSKAAKHLVGYPVDDLLIEHSLRKASWRIFAPSETGGAPPAYGGEGKRSRKRSRQGSPSSPLQPPRRLTRQSSVNCCSDHEHSPQSHSSDKTIPFTAEEEAHNFQRALGLGHQAAFISAAIKEQLSVHIDDAVNAAVARQLPAYLTEGLHTAAVDASVNTQLRPVLQAILPKMFDEVSPKILQETLSKILQEVLPKMLQENLRDELPVLLGLALRPSRQAPDHFDPAQSSSSNPCDTLLNDLFVAYVRPRLESFMQKESCDRIERLEDSIEGAVEKVEEKIDEAVETVKDLCDEEREDARLELSRHLNDLTETLVDAGQEVIDKAENTLSDFKEDMVYERDDALSSFRSKLDDMMSKSGQAETLRFLHRTDDAEADTEATTEDESSFKSSVRSSKPAENSPDYSQLHSSPLHVGQTDDSETEMDAVDAKEDSIGHKISPKLPPAHSQPTCPTTRSKREPQEMNRFFYEPRGRRAGTAPL